jgi:hypothetical protein
MEYRRTVIEMKARDEMAGTSNVTRTGLRESPVQPAGVTGIPTRGSIMRTLLLALLLLLGCADVPAGVSLLRSGELRYTARGATGEPLLGGQLELTVADDSTVRGTWTIGWLPGADTTLPVGPQIGSGELTGTRSGDTLRIQLNPGYADNNVGLLAIVDASGYSGQWEWSTIVGPRSGGSFAASRQ